jgi:hypothetical protein
MNEEAYIKRKDELNRQLLARRDDLDKIVFQYIEVLSQLIQGWSMDTIETAIMDEAEITKSLPESQLREMKEEMNALLDQYPALVQAELDTDEMWPHRMDIPKDLHKDRMEIQLAVERRRARVDESIRRILGQVGLILRNYGFINEDRRIWDFGPDDRATYRYPLPRDRETDGLMAEYFELLRGYGEVAYELRDLEHTKEAEEAKRRWDRL